MGWLRQSKLMYDADPGKGDGITGHGRGGGLLQLCSRCNDGDYLHKLDDGSDWRA
jgi:hypothetical protein